ncbi:hypothetical protein VKT23_009948 [Stygiomarasmius scandens]|uniref:Uncharacterized protein n=1 Tax=Marasmiellus scandens TaxID=2682957 RepID=A0ABR1JHV5_9AGAR
MTCSIYIRDKPGLNTMQNSFPVTVIVTGHTAITTQLELDISPFCDPGVDIVLGTDILFLRMLGFPASR